MFHYVTPPFGFLSLFRTFEVLRASAVGRITFLILLRVPAPGPFNQSMAHCSTGLSSYFALSSASDAALLSFVPRFQRPGGY